MCWIRDGGWLRGYMDQRGRVAEGVYGSGREGGGEAE